MKATKKILLNLDAGMYAQVDIEADRARLTVTEWVREAIRLRLAIPIQTDQSLLDAPPFDPTPTVVQPLDKPTAEQWTAKLLEWRRLPGSEAMAALLKATGGRRPPADLFSNADKLGQWMADNV